MGFTLAAIKEMAVLAGLRVAKREKAQPSLDQMNDEELMAVIRRGEPH